MTKEMYEDLLGKNKLQISELNTLTEEQDRHIVELKKENTGLKTRWQCRNKYMCSENGKAFPCYTLYDCLDCHYKSE